MTTLASIIDRARLRHPSFRTLAIPEGALVLEADIHQRALVLQFGGAIDGLVNTSVELAVVINGALVGVDSDGVTPVYQTTYQDGWPTHLDADGVTPYVNFTETKIAGDPFGEHGGTPGFPLPDDFLKVVKGTVVYGDNRVGALDIVAEVARLERTRMVTPTAFISGNRLVPCRWLTTGNYADAWSNDIRSIQLSYVALPVLTALTDTIMLPAVMHESLVARLADALSGMMDPLVPALMNRTGALVAASDERLDEYGQAMLDTATRNRVQYRG